MDQTQQLAQLHAYTYEKMSHDHTRSRHGAH